MSSTVTKVKITYRFAINIFINKQDQWSLPILGFIMLLLQQKSCDPRNQVLFLRKNIDA